MKIKQSSCLSLLLFSFPSDHHRARAELCTRKSTLHVICFCRNSARLKSRLRAGLLLILRLHKRSHRAYLASARSCRQNGVEPIAFDDKPELNQRQKWFVMKDFQRSAAVYLSRVAPNDCVLLNKTQEEQSNHQVERKCDVFQKTKARKSPHSHFKISINQLLFIQR